MTDTVTYPLSVLKDQPGVQGLAQLGRNALERITDLERELAEVKEQLRLCNVDQFTTAAELAETKEELNDKRKFCYAVEQALDGMKGDYIEIIVALREDAERYRRLNNDAFN